MIVDPTYLDDGELREQDGVPLKRFLAYQDRAKVLMGGQPFFSGREREISAFRQVLNALSEGIQGDATIAVEAPPGAGKSALLGQFIEEMKRLPPTEDKGRRWLPVLINGARAECPSHIAQAVEDAIGRRLASDHEKARNSLEAQEKASNALSALIGEAGLRKVSHDVAKLVGIVLDRGFGAAGIQLGGARSDEDIESVAARRGALWDKWQIVLLVDEAQAISKKAPGAVEGTLSSIHQGFAHAPISFCAFGLPGTRSALWDVGVSRRSGPCTLHLPGLERREAEMAVSRCFAQYEIEGGEVWKRAILERADGWPQHLKTYMDAACSVLAKQAAAENVLGDARKSSLAEAIAVGDEARAERCRDRIESLNDGGEGFDEYARALAPTFERAQGRPKKSDVKAFLDNDLMLDRDSVNRFIKAAKRCGFLGPDTDLWRYAMPIPSLAGYLLGKPLPPAPEPEPPAEPGRPAKKANDDCRSPGGP